MMMESISDNTLNKAQGRSKANLLIRQMLKCFTYVAFSFRGILNRLKESQLDYKNRLPYLTTRKVKVINVCMRYAINLINNID